MMMMMTTKPLYRYKLRATLSSSSMMMYNPMRYKTNNNNNNTKKMSIHVRKYNTTTSHTNDSFNTSCINNYISCNNTLYAEARKTASVRSSYCRGSLSSSTSQSSAHSHTEIENNSSSCSSNNSKQRDAVDDGGDKSKKRNSLKNGKTSAMTMSANVYNYIR